MRTGRIVAGPWIFLGAVLLFDYRNFRNLGGLGAVHQLDKSHGRIVANAEPNLENAQVATIAGGIAGPQFAKNLCDRISITQPIEGQTTISQIGALA